MKMIIRISILFLLAILLAGCSVPDPLADRIHAIEEKSVHLYKMDHASQLNLDAVNREVTLAKSQGLSPSELEPLVKKRAEIVKEIDNAKEVTRLDHDYNLLTAEWERKHPGQKFRSLAMDMF